MALLFFIFWIVLNGKCTEEIILIGVGISSAAMVFACKACGWSLKKEKGLYRASPGFLFYCALVLREIIKANLAMAKAVYAEKADPKLCEIHTVLKSRLAKMALANAITLTPGTLTVSCRDDVLVIHCLTEKMAKGLKREHELFEKRLLKIEEALRG